MGDVGGCTMLDGLRRRSARCAAKVWGQKNFGTIPPRPYAMWQSF